MKSPEEEFINLLGLFYPSCYGLDLEEITKEWRSQNEIVDVVDAVAAFREWFYKKNGTIDCSCKA